MEALSSQPACPEVVEPQSDHLYHRTDCRCLKGRIYPKQVVSGILFCGDHLRLRPERRVGLAVVVCVGRRVGCYSLPTPDLWEGPGAYVPSRVFDVPAQDGTATPAPIPPGSDRHRLAMVASGVIYAGMGRPHPHIRDTSFLGFVSQYEVVGLARRKSASRAFSVWGL